MSITGSAHLAGKWAEITGDAPVATRQDEAQQVTGSLRDRLSKVNEDAARLLDAAGTLSVPRSASPAAPAAPPPAQTPPGQTQAPAAATTTGGPLPPPDQAKLWQLLNDTPGGISLRRVENGGLLRRVNPAPGGKPDWSVEYVRQQLQVWANAGKVRLIGGGREQRWQPVHLRIVRDDQPEPETAVSVPRESSQAACPDGLSDHDPVMLAASCGLSAPDEATGRAAALQAGIPDHLVDQAINLLRHDREYVAAEVSRIVSGARMPAPAGRPPPARMMTNPTGTTTNPTGRTTKTRTWMTTRPRRDRQHRRLRQLARSSKPAVSPAYRSSEPNRGTAKPRQAPGRDQQ